MPPHEVIDATIDDGGTTGGWWRPRWDAVSYPVTRWLGMAGVLWFTVWFSANHLTRNPSYPDANVVAFTGDWLLGGWVRWDSGWYALIAEGGYSYTPGVQSTVAYFPSYPLAVRLLHLVGGDVRLIGVLVTAVCGFGATILVYRWCLRRLSVDASRLAVLLLISFPYAWYLFGVMYADALFLVFTVGAFVLLDRDHPLLAGLAAMVAVGARPVGIGVFIGLLAVGLERRGALTIPFFDRVRADGWREAWRQRTFAVHVHVGRLRPGDVGLLLPVTSLVAWMAYLDRTFGDPFLFANAQAAWEQQPGRHTWFKVTWLQYLKALPSDLLHPHEQWDHLIYGLGITLQAALVILCLCLVPLVVRRIGWPYAVYVVAVVGVPLMGSKDWQGTGRYLLAAFPVVAVVAAHLVEHRSPAARRALTTTSAALLVFLASGFARGHYLA